MNHLQHSVQRTTPGMGYNRQRPNQSCLNLNRVEVTVATSMEHDSNTKEIVDNKTVRIDEEVQPTGTLDDLFMCRGCKATGHVLESCPVDHGRTYTDCQLFQWEQTKAQVSQM